MTKGFLSKPPKKGKNKPVNNQKALVKQRQGQDLALGNVAQNLIPGVENSMSQPFQYTGPKPWEQAGDIKGLQQQYQDEMYNSYLRQAQPEFDKQLTDFNTDMTQRGIPIGSELYDREKKNLLDQQEASKQNIRSNAIMGAAQYGGQWQDINNQNFTNAYGFVS